ncbi:Serine/arginine-rich splicing factor RS31A [Hibiscus syriacus]|uniref:Serine/arginine-rich splicing factor RS31A n=1 Tax=Hibiscus syriacus TaxID=106335 RepID=A0A6A2WSU1_HIBSY|nr:Serine/arginine-rich splicing factor RS31A [Hibiscus syriacus]
MDRLYILVCISPYFTYAIRGLDNITFGYDRQRLSVEWAKGERGRHRDGSSSVTNQRPTKTLFVINFDPICTRDRDILRHFEPYGKVLHVCIRRNFAFVQFTAQEGATKALEATQRSKLLDRVVSVEYALRDDDEKDDRYGSPRIGGGYGRRGLVLAETKFLILQFDKSCEDLSIISPTDFFCGALALSANLSLILQAMFGQSAIQKPWEGGCILILVKQSMTDRYYMRKEDGVYDVTKRYTRNWNEVLSRRTITRESSLVEALDEDLLSTDDAPISLPGRQSGDKQWRIPRSEFGTNSLSSSACEVRIYRDEHVTKIYNAFSFILHKFVEEYVIASKGEVL